MSALREAIRRVVADLTALDRRFALIGGLAVSVRAEPRFTRDVDVAVAVASDEEAEALAHELQGRGYRVLAVVEQKAQGRLATLRLDPPEQSLQGVVIDLLFASSGIEIEIAMAADSIEVFPGLMVPVARGGHLLALKVLARDDARRPQDMVDIRALVAACSPEDITLAREAVKLIERRGFARGRELPRLLEEVLDSTTTRTGSPDDKAEALSPTKPRPKRAQKRRRSS